MEPAGMGCGTEGWRSVPPREGADTVDGRGDV